jgi:peptidoglycan endopeptidase LytF
MERNVTPVICPRGASRYTWREGDTLRDLAILNGISEQAIRLANQGRDLSALKPGDELCIPPQQLSCVSGDLYTVQRGDTFSSIAERFGITTLELSERNPYVDPSNLRSGEVLCVPKTPPIDDPNVSPTPPEGLPTPSLPGPSAPPVRPVRRCPNGYTSGTVQYGQSYADLLLRYNISYQAFRLANPNLNPSRLLPGQAYCVPPSGARGLCSGTERSYVIRQNEDLFTLAQKFGTTQGRLLRINPNLAPGDFIPGRVICLP